uniref:Uncharacterized protein n=1 Tax=Candidatus Kentrum sp. FM TaxID=2126340 RepID=A0A450TIK0_9GAMM|nr:MAG: hypothetical protein BECKFM1743A_GA0114220_104364 [Candidatus Kentron sp. FM]
MQKSSCTPNIYLPFFSKVGKTDQRFMFLLLMPGPPLLQRLGESLVKHPSLCLMARIDLGSLFFQGAFTGLEPKPNLFQCPSERLFLRFLPAGGITRVFLARILFGFDGCSLAAIFRWKCRRGRHRRRQTLGQSFKRKS